MRILLTSVTLLLLAATLTPSGSAQDLEPRIEVTTSLDALPLAHNKTSGTIQVTVINRGPAAGQVVLNAKPLDGWRFDFDPTHSFSLARDGQRTVGLKVTADDEAANQTLQILGNFQESTTGRPSTEVKREVELMFLPAPMPPPLPPPPGKPWALIAGVGGLVFAALMLLQVGSVRLSVSSPRLEITQSGSGYVRVTITNRWWPPRRVYVRVRDVPSPAVAALSIRDARLRRGESVSVPMLVKAPLEMPDGTKSISVQAKAGFLGPWTTRKRVRLTFRSPVAPDAPLEPRVPIILQN